MHEAVRAYRALGWCLIPIRYGEKEPASAAWEKLRFDDQKCAKVWPGPGLDWNIALNLGPSRMCSLDIDTFDEACSMLASVGVDLRALMVEHPYVTSGPGKVRILFRIPDGVDLGYHKALTADKQCAFELRSGDRFDLLPPSLHPSGRLYQWAGAKRKPDVVPAALLAFWQERDSARAARAAEHDDGGEHPLIEAFNRDNPLEAVLYAYGYTRDSDACWVSPHSSSGRASVNILDGERCWIRSPSDPLCSESTGRPVSSFDLWAHYVHNGNRGAALRALERLANADLFDSIAKAATEWAKQATPR